MSLNDTPSGERVHIGFFGRRNAGKSSLVNAVTGQDLAVVSAYKGTTTDPVNKAMELLPLGPVVIIDTPGYDDEGELGTLRVKKTRQVLARTDLAILVTDATEDLTEWETELIGLFRSKQIPYLLVRNKADLLEDVPESRDDRFFVSSKTGYNIGPLKDRMAALGTLEVDTRPLVGDLVKPNDLVFLVIPIDKAAPKGRLILPQQQVIRDLLDYGACPVCVRETELKHLLDSGIQPRLVITDSQVFKFVSQVVPESIPLTSFSILMARKKGFLDTAVYGAAAIDSLQDGDTVLISEGCTHHRQCGDIGSVKLPALLRRFTGKEISIELSSGKGFPEDLSPYALVLHCGGCMLGGREVRSRMQLAQDRNIPITNYGIAIAYLNGILRRSLAVFPDLMEELNAQEQ